MRLHVHVLPCCAHELPKTKPMAVMVLYTGIGSTAEDELISMGVSSTPPQQRPTLERAASPLGGSHATTNLTTLQALVHLSFWPCPDMPKSQVDKLSLATMLWRIQQSKD